MAIKRWEFNADWQAWVNENQIDGETRILGDSLRLPTESSTPEASGLDTITDLARWRFAQEQDLNDTIGSHHGTVPGGVPAVITEIGLLAQTKNGYATVVDDTDFSFPDASNGLILSCWIKSTSLDYSGGMGVIAAYHTGLDNGDISYALAVDTDNKLKVKVTVAGTTFDILPDGGDVSIDSLWHHLMFYMTDNGTNALFIVDNEGSFTPTAVNADAIGGSPEFSILSSEFGSFDSFGFAGYIDELEIREFTASGTEMLTFNNKKFDRNVFLSDVVDAQESGLHISSILSEFDATGGSSATFAFRASDSLFTQTDTTLSWTGFTAPNQIATGSVVDLSDLGISVRGRYQQVKIKLAPSNVYSSESDSLQRIDPSVSVLEINSSKSAVLLGPTNPAFDPGIMLGQEIDFSGSKTIHKVSLNLTVSSTDRSLFHIGQAGSVSFQSANFTDSNNEWVFQPVLHWLPANDWQTSGTTIVNSLQTVNYDVYAIDEYGGVNVPYLSYRLFLPDAGVYDLWGYGYCDGSGIFWTWDGDTTHLRQMNLGLETVGWIGIPRWTRFGSFYVEEGGLHTFTVYLAESNTTILDQWYFTTNHSLTDDLDFLSDGYITPLPLSKGPFMTVLRLRSLFNNSTDSLESPAVGSKSVSSWLPSQKVAASGKFNYAIQNDADGTGVTFSNGVSLDFWQIGGSAKDFASWDFIFTNSQVGPTFISYDYGQTIQ